MERKWCKVKGIGRKSLFAETEGGELVIISKQYTGMAEAQKGDIIEFSPCPFVPNPGTAFPRMPKFYADFPEVIALGRRFTTKPPVTRPRPDATAVDWKAKKEHDADIDGLREVRAGAART